ncbi:MAG: ABC transporter transmembrane domain-containing protein, partial [Chloroflexota bacterium]|nr:ABC transporter transmembrane domain-containing protein [Chloroflexota bacterium]
MTQKAPRTTHGAIQPGEGHSLWRAMAHLRSYRRDTAGAFMSLLLVTAANLAAPQLMRVPIDTGIARRRTDAVLWAVLGLLGVAVIRGVFTFLQGYLAERASQGVAFDLRDALFARIQRLSFSYHDRVETGQLLTRVTNDVEQI